MIVQKFRQLLAQAFVRLALMPKHDGAFEQCVLQVVRQLTPQIRGGCAESQKVAGGNIVDDLIGLLTHDLTHCKISLQDDDIGPSLTEKQRSRGQSSARLIGQCRRQLQLWPARD